LLSAKESVIKSTDCLGFGAKKASEKVVKIGIEYLVSSPVNPFFTEIVPLKSEKQIFRKK